MKEVKALYELLDDKYSDPEKYPPIVTDELLCNHDGEVGIFMIQKYLSGELGIVVDRDSVVAIKDIGYDELNDLFLEYERRATATQSLITLAWKKIAYHELQKRQS